VGIRTLTRGEPWLVSIALLHTLPGRSRAAAPRSLGLHYRDRSDRCQPPGRPGGTGQIGGLDYPFGQHRSREVLG